MICCTSAAETAAAVHDGGVGEEESGGVVGSWDGHGGQGGKGVACWIEEFGGKLRGVIAEGVGVDLAAGYEDGS